MKVEASGGGGAAPVKVKWRRREVAAMAGGRRRGNGGGGGVSVRPRRRARWPVQADAAPRTLLGQLFAACRVAFRGGPDQTVPAPVHATLLRTILDKIEPEDVRKFLDAANTDASSSGPHQMQSPIITRTTIYHCRNFSIEIFTIPPGAVIPLHNHPGMTVFSKLLSGSLHIKSYDWASPADHHRLAAGGSTTHGVARLARLVMDTDLTAPCAALVLYPESGGNMHRFAAATPCAVLDVLGPPYSKDRDCTYYQDFPYSNLDDPVITTGDVGATDEAKKAHLLAWLKETGKPRDLNMYEVPYTGPPIL